MITVPSRYWNRTGWALAAACAVLRCSAATLESDFAAPPQAAKPYVWWHWMSNSITSKGIDRDLAAMQEMGIGGAMITNLASVPSLPGHIIEHSPWPETKYYSEPWWKLYQQAFVNGTARGLDMGTVNCPGWAVSGGPWITAERSMQKLIWSATPAVGPGRVTAPLPQHKVDPKWNFYRDVAVVAVRDGDEVKVEDAIDVSSHLGPDGTLDWTVPAGKWTIYRFGHTTTGKMVNPLPDGFEALEVDKLSAAASAFDIEQLLGTLKGHLTPEAMTDVHFVHFDSFEAGTANWTEEFARQFAALRGYDPVTWLPVLAGRPIGGKAMAARFEWDLRQTYSDLFIRNNLGTFARMLKDAGIRMSLEPYTGPFDAIAATAAPELPMTEFWSKPAHWLAERAETHEVITAWVAASAQALRRKVVCAEFLTGWPMDSEWTEEPGGLKPTVDFALCSGINQYQLHSWVLQPFGDEVKPGMTLGWWGTHFGRNQTWAKPGKAFMSYLARCAAVLQHGEVVSDYCNLEFSRRRGDSITNEQLLGGKVEDGRIVIPGGRSYAALVLDPGERRMLPAVVNQLKALVAAGAAVVGPKPLSAFGLQGYPSSDAAVSAVANEIWGSVDGIAALHRKFGAGDVYWNTPVAEVLAARGLGPDLTVECPPAATLDWIHRREDGTDVYFVANLGDAAVATWLNFRVAGKVPELWFPTDGHQEKMAWWRQEGAVTRMPLTFSPHQAVLVVFRTPAATFDPVVAVARNLSTTIPLGNLGLIYLQPGTYAQQSMTTPAGALPDVRVTVAEDGTLSLRAARPGDYELTLASGRTAHVTVPELGTPHELTGAWSVQFDPPVGPARTVAMKTTASWTDSTDPEVKYFSGTATYRRQLVLAAGELKPGGRLILDLGSVKDMVQVKVNGRDLGVIWVEPFVIDLTDVVHAGANDLELAVTNTWHNRLIGDEQQPPDLEWREARMFRRTIPVGAALVRYPEWLVHGQPRPSPLRRTFVSWNYFTKDTPLTAAGLIGPVVLRREAQVAVPRP